MANLTPRATARPSAPPRKLLLVRPPARSVRGPDQGEHLPLHLAIGVIVAMGIVLMVWLIGHLGFHLGFAPLVRVPELGTAPGSGLATGTLVVISIPRAVFQAGLSRPDWLMFGFALIALPAAALGAARPRTPGGPHPPLGLATLAVLGAVLAMLNGAALIWWTVCPFRTGMLRVLPARAAEAAAWHADMQAVAGFDVLAVVCAALWVVLVFRLPIALWLRAMAASATLFTLIVVAGAMAISSTAATQAAAPRSLVVFTHGTGVPRILLGSTPRATVTVVAHGDDVRVELEPETGGATVVARQSLIGYLRERGAAR